LENSSVMCNCPTCWIACFVYWKRRLAVCADFSEGWHWRSVSAAYGLLSNEHFPMNRAVWMLSPIAKLPLKGFQKAVNQSGKVRLSRCTLTTVRVVGTACLPYSSQTFYNQKSRILQLHKLGSWSLCQFILSSLNACSQVQTWTLSGCTLLSKQGPWCLNPSRGSV
jgi:hypothetical protein